MRYLETSQDKVSNLALDIFYRDEKEIKEKKRILTKLRDYFQNDELFTVQESRKQLTRLQISKKGQEAREMANYENEAGPNVNKEIELLPG